MPLALPARVATQAQDLGRSGLPERPGLARLTLNVSNQCPLACRYCYANQGVYDTPGLLMTPETAFDAVNLVSRRYSSIAHVSFFGGEPTLNPQVIDLVCHYASYLYARGVLTHMPSFGLTTSGYQMSDRMVRLIRDHDITVTMSLDGPKSVHDELRVTKRGGPTFERVAASIDAVTAATGQGPEIECTYTALHLRRGLDLIDLLDFVHERFGTQVLHAPMVVVPPSSTWYVPLDQALALYVPALRYSVDNCARGLGKTLSIAARILAVLADRHPVGAYCPAGIETIVVNADGNVYPCPMLMGAGRRLGNVSDPTAELSLPSPTARLIAQADTKRNQACQECWARPLCFGCIAEDLARGAPPEGRSCDPGKAPWCDFRRALVQTVLTSADAVLAKG